MRAYAVVLQTVPTRSARTHARHEAAHICCVKYSNNARKVLMIPVISTSIRLGAESRTKQAALFERGSDCTERPWSAF